MAALQADGYRPDEFAVGTRVVYSKMANGVMGSRLPDWEKVFGCSATARNWNTVTRLRELASGEVTT
ncbi:MAG: hypothetical protein ACRD1K_08630 [Acidimicrobiales bacterium]